MSSEFQMIADYFSNLGASKKEVLLDVGDDCALLQSDLPLAISTDTLISGVHFPENTSPTAIAYKALAVSLSDLAALGATPLVYTLNLSLPALADDWLHDFRQGLRLLSETFGLRLIGGDSTRSPVMMVVTTVFGQCSRPWRRNQAQVGDIIWVSGTLGDAALGLTLAKKDQSVKEDKALLSLTKKEVKYLLNRLHYPRPRLPLVAHLSQEVHAAIDISDGFLADLGHILSASQCAAQVFLHRLPLSLAYQHWQKMCPVDRDVIAFLPALTGGDDYELCFTASPSATQKILSAAKILGLPCAAVGEIILGSGIKLFYQDQEIALPSILGFTHW
jgi:thiamine-monophosphate kinase